MATSEVPSRRQEMRLFLGQLKLLLWKNAVLKKRRPVVTILETVIPLMIFVILVLMRLRLPPIKEPIQMPKHHPLVSAGLIPVIQSVCINEKVCKPYGVPNGSYFHELLLDINELYTTLLTSDLKKTQKDIRQLLSIRSSRTLLEEYGIDYKQLSQELKNLGLTMDETATFSATFLTNSSFRNGVRTLVDKYSESEFFKQQFEKQQESELFTEEKFAVLMELSNKMPKLLDWLGFLPEDTCGALVDQDYDMRRLTKAALEMWHRIQPDLCANYEKLTMQDIDLKRFEKLNLQTHQFLMLQHWQNFLTKNLKILFTPITNDTMKIVDQLSSTVNTLQGLPVFLDNYLRVSAGFRQYLNEKNPDAYSEGVTILDVITFLNVEFTDTEPNFGANVNETYPALKTNFMLMLDVFDRASCAMKLLLGNRDLEVFQGIKTESEAVDLMVNGDAAREGNRVLAVIVFDVDEKGKLGSHVTYKIRQLHSETADTQFVRSPYWYPGSDTHGLNEYNYFTYGFLWMQDLVDRAIINYQLGRTIKSPGLYIQKFPTPCYDNDVFSQVIEHGMPLFMLLSWIYFSSVLVNAVAKEKETRLKESMRMMGLTRIVHWTAWFLTAFLHMQVTLVSLVLLIKFGKLLPVSDPFVLYTFFSLFCACMICFCFFMSCLFHSSQVASAFTGILLLFLHIPFTFIHILETYNKKIISGFIKSLACLVPVTPMAIGVKYFTIYEIQKEGIQWSNIASSPSDGDTFSVLNAMFMMIVDTFIYALLAWYIEAVRPGPYGIPLPWYFPFMQSYWSSKQDPAEVSMKCRLGRCAQEEDDRDSSTYINQTYAETAATAALAVEPLLGENQPTCNPVDVNLFESDPTDLDLGVAIRNLSKKYKHSAGKFALRNLTLNMYEGQITALLGHNGAGKSTTMSILCGVQPPSFGTARIYNKDIRFQIDAIREDMGMCPQHNVLFENLTVEEHLFLFAKLKLPEASRSEIRSEIERLLHDMDLPADRHTLVRKLSSGVQRKLSVALTFIGDPKLIILDEPTSNVDPQARRAIWDLLIKYKDNHTILMSTHFMDEAQMLGDRIAMISGGVLRCVGTPIYLLNRLGAGYHLTLYRSHSIHHAASSINSNLLASFSPSLRTSTSAEVTQFVRKFIPEATLQKHSQNELEYILPREFVETENFESLLTELSSNLSKFGLTSFGLRDTSLEEVFFRICEDAGNLANGSQSNTPEVAADLNESCRVSHVDEHEHDPELNMTHIEDNSESHSVTPEVEDMASNSQQQRPLPRLPPTELNNNATMASKTTTNNNDSNNNHNVQEMTNLLRNEEDGGNPQTNGHGCGGVTVDSNTQKSNTDTDDLFDKKHEKRATGISLLFNQFLALSNKKILLTLKNPKLLLTQIAFPLLFMMAAMVMAFMSTYTGDTKELRLSTAQYQPYHVPVHIKNKIPVAAVISSFNSSLADGNADAGPLDLVETLQYDSGIGADCTLAPNKAFSALFPSALTTNSNMPSFLNPQWCLVGKGPLYDSLKLKSAFDSNATFSYAEKKFLNIYSSFAQKCENAKHRCEECHDGVLTCFHTPGEKSRSEMDDEHYDEDVDEEDGQFFWDTWGNDRIIDVSQDANKYGFDVDDQFQLHAFDYTERNRYGGLVFKDYVYETGMVADLPDVYSSLFAKQQAKVYYNSKGYHSVPIYVNAANNAILRANLNKFNKSVKAEEFGITTYSQPIRAGSLPSKNLMDHGNDVIVAMLVLAGFSSLPASFLMHLVYERTHKMKHLQLVSGMHPVVYWLSNFVWDFITACIPVLLSYLIIITIDVRAYNEGDNNLALLYLMLTYVWAVIPFMYLFSFVLNEPATAYVGLGVANLLTGVITVIVVYVFDTVVQNDEVISKINSILKSCFVIVPIYNLGHGFTYVAFNQILNDFYQSFGLDEKVVEPFDWNATLRGIVVNLVQGIIAFLLVLLCEYNLFLDISVKTEEQPPIVAQSHKKSSVHSPTASEAATNNFSPSASEMKTSQLNSTSNPGSSSQGGGLCTWTQDPDVKAEKERVKRSRDPIRLINLTKVYTSLDLGRFRAVNNINVGIRQGEIFGLCGSNGSGKTELFKLLTLDSHPSEGTIIIDNHNAAKYKSRIWKSIGYCPQQDALFGEMTAKQHLELYATLRGYSRKSISKVVSTSIAEMDLMDCRDKIVDSYSGGMKRKLSAALTLLGQPKIVILDDPTAGMDPRSRRFLWTLIKKLNEHGRTVIFASNSMDECERLCSRLAIMVRGSFISIGSVNYLKSRHGDMYNIKCRLRPQTDNSLIARFMKQRLPKAQVVEEHFNVITYEIGSEHINLPSVFSLLGSNKEALGIVDYSVSQKTLEMGYMNIIRRELLLEQQHQQRIKTNHQYLLSHRGTSDKNMLPLSPTGTGSVSPSNLDTNGSPQPSNGGGGGSTRAKFSRALKLDQQTGHRLANHAETTTP